MFANYFFKEKQKIKGEKTLFQYLKINIHITIPMDVHVDAEHYFIDLICTGSRSNKVRAHYIKINRRTIFDYLYFLIDPVF